MLYTLKGGYVYTNKKIVKTNIIVENGIITEISDKELGKIIDVSNKYIAPSFIDPHVHMREPGFCDSEDHRLPGQCGVQPQDVHHRSPPCRDRR